MAEYEVVVGLEVHCELATKTKLFCRCSTRFGDPPNTNVCPICLGFPGTLPKPNKEAVRLAVIAAKALNCEINLSSKFDRKNYFYPDLPKGYQISQFDEALANNGFVKIGEPTDIVRIKRLHLEEDASKSIHAGDDITSASYTLVDFNRGGVPLIEIVSEPDMRSSDDVKVYLEKLQKILAFSGVSDVKIEEGSMRVDCNISVRQKGSKELGTPCEIKNLGSIRSCARAVDYEFQRQKEVLEQGGTIKRQTRHWDEGLGITIPLRDKETSDDYRYFPDPDLPRLELTPEFVQEAIDSMPELPDTIVARYMEKLGLSQYDAEVLTSSPYIARFFNECVELKADPKQAANWIMGDLIAYMKGAGIPYETIPVTPGNLVLMLQLIQEGVISGKIAKDILVKMIETGKDPRTIVKEEGLEQVSDEESLSKIADEVIAANPKAVESIKAGQEKAIGFLVGQVMKATKGKANPAMVNIILKNKLK